MIRGGMRSVVGRLAGRATVAVVVPRKDVDLSVDGAHNGAAPGGSEEAFAPQVPFPFQLLNEVYDDEDFARPSMADGELCRVCDDRKRCVRQ